VNFEEPLKWSGDTFQASGRYPGSGGYHIDYMGVFRGSEAQADVSGLSLASPTVPFNVDV
jgi:hypothetical protein